MTLSLSSLAARVFLAHPAGGSSHLDTVILVGLVVGLLAVVGAYLKRRR